MQEPTDDSDLQQMMEGIGSSAPDSSGSNVRMMNKDGSFNSGKRALAWHERLTYNGLLTVSWPRFFLFLIAVYCFSNVMFAALFLLCGPSALSSNGPDTGLGLILRSFFFSVQTLSTIGYGALVPVGTAANVLVAIESIYGLLAYSLITGLFFARFSRIRARLRFSRLAVICSQHERRSPANPPEKLEQWSSHRALCSSSLLLFGWPKECRDPKVCSFDNRSKRGCFYATRMDFASSDQPR